MPGGWPPVSLFGWREVFKTARCPIPAIGSVNVKVSASTGGLISGLGSAGVVVKNFGTQVKGLGAGITSTLGGGIKSVTSGIVGMTAKLGPLAAGIAAAAGAGGLGLMVKSSFDTLDANKKLSASLGISQDQLSGYQHAADLSGVSSEALEGALGKLTRKGMTLEGLADQMAAIQSPTERAQLAFKVLGKSGQDLIPLLSEGGAAIREMAADGVMLKGSFSNTDISGIEMANDAVSRVGASFVGIANSVAVYLAPAIKTVADKVVTLGTWTRDTFEGMKPVFNEVASTLVAHWTNIGIVFSTVYNSISEMTGITFGGIASAAWTTIKSVVGFFSNFQSNISSIYTWLGTNWFNLLKDMGSGLLVFTGNMLTNIGVAFKGAMRVITAFDGWVVGVFKRLFSFEVVDAVLTGLITIGQKIRDWASVAWETIKNIFTGQDPGKGMDGFLKTVKGDFENGMNDINLSKTLGGILKDTAAEFTNPLDGFKSSLTDLPTIKFDIPGLGAATEGVKSLGMDIAKIDDMAAMKDTADQTMKKAGKGIGQLEVPQAVQRGSSDAISAIFKAQRGGEADKIAAAQLKEATKTRMLLEKQSKIQPVELVAGDV